MASALSTASALDSWSAAAEDRFFLVATAAARAGYVADLVGVASASTSARGEEELWDRVARVSVGAGRRTRLMFAAAHGDASRLAFLLARVAPLHARDVSSKDESRGDDGRASGRTALLWAAANGHTTCVKDLLDALAVDAARALPPGTARELGTEATDESGASALHLAACGGHSGVVRLLLARGLEPDALDTVGRSPLYFAAREGHCDIVELLLAAGALAERVRDDGWSAILIAVQGGHVRIAELLAEAGADVARAAPPMRRTWNALHVSTYHDKVEMLDALLSGRIRGGGALNLLAADYDGFVPLFYSYSLKVAATLLGARSGAAAHAQLVARGRRGETIFHWRTDVQDLSALISAAEREGVLRKLLNSRDKSGDTPLLGAAQRNADVAIELLSAGADPHVRSRSGSTVIGVAIASLPEAEAERLVRAALNLGVDARAVWFSSRVRVAKRDSALALAAGAGAVRLVEQLLRAGAGRSYVLRIPARVANSDTFSYRPRALLRCLPIAPPTLLEAAGNVAVVDLALARGARPMGAAMVAAASRKRPAVVERLLTAGVPASRAALLAAISSNDAASARLLVRAGAQLQTAPTPGRSSDLFSVSFRNFSFDSSDDDSADAGLVDTLKLLVESGCSAAEHFYESAPPRGWGTRPNQGLLHNLVWAMRSRRVLAAAVELGAGVDVAFCRGLTPLVQAILASSDAATIESLLAIGAAPAGPPGAAIPPLAAAALIGRLDAVTILLAAGAQPAAPSLYLAASGATSGAAAVIEALAASGANVDERSVVGTTPLFAATAAAARANDTRSKIHSTARAAYAAAAVNALIAAGADARLADARGRTPLHAAALGAPAELLFDLAAARGGVDVDAIDAEGATPLIFAAEAGDKRCATVLLALGADARGTNGGAVPADVARARGHTRLADVLARAAAGLGAHAAPAVARSPEAQPLNSYDLAAAVNSSLDDEGLAKSASDCGRLLMAAERALAGLSATAIDRKDRAWSWPWARRARVAAEA